LTNPLPAFHRTTHRFNQAGFGAPKTCLINQSATTHDETPSSEFAFREEFTCFSFHEENLIAKDQNTYAKRKREAEKRAKAEEKLARKKRKQQDSNDIPLQGTTADPDDET